MTKNLLALLAFAISEASFAAADTYTTSAFIQSASPTRIIDTRQNINDQYKNKHHTYHIESLNSLNVAGAKPSFGRNGIPLFAGKKKDAGVLKDGKIQVKLLKHIDGTGHIGDVIMVTPAFFTNKLQKSGSAVRITDEEVVKEHADKMLHEKEQKENALVVKEKLEKMKLSMSMKAGPEGHLFGGVGYKTILDELKKDFPRGCLDGKQVKITEIKVKDGKKLRGDIKEIGDFVINISLLKDVSASLELSVVQE